MILGSTLWKTGVDCGLFSPGDERRVLILYGQIFNMESSLGYGDQASEASTMPGLSLCKSAPALPALT